MRALFYYHALDFFRNIPMVTENDPVGSYIPPRYTAQQTFDYIESELKDCVATCFLPLHVLMARLRRALPTLCLPSSTSTARPILGG